MSLCEFWEIFMNKFFTEHFFSINFFRWTGGSEFDPERVILQIDWKLAQK